MRLDPWKYLLALSVAGCGVPSAPAPASSSVATVKAASAAGRAAVTALARGAHDSFALRAVRDGAGGRHEHFTQTYRGLPVLHAGASVHFDARGSIVGIRDRTHADVDVDIVPRVPADDAEALVRADFGAGPGARSAAELVIDSDLQKQVTRTRAAGSPLNSAEVTRVPVRHLLAWHVTVADGERGANYVVDATTGDIRQRRSTEHGNTNATVTGNSEYSGIVHLVSETNDNGELCGKFSLIDRTRNGCAVASYGSDQIFFDNDGTFGDGQAPTQDYSQGDDDCDPLYTRANAQTAGVDVAFGMDVTWDMYKNVFGQNGWDGDGKPISAYAHKPNAGSNYIQPILGAQEHINLGDGALVNGSMAHVTPHTGIESVGHETTHGVDYHLGTLGTWSDSNVLSEGVADIFGALARMYERSGNFATHSSTIADTGIDDYTLFDEYETGLDSKGNAKHDSERFCDRPSRDGASPDAWFDGIDDLDSHSSGGPIRRAFFFMARGSSGHVDFKHDSDWNSHTELIPWGMTGIGVAKTAKILYHSFFGCMDDETYDNARSCAISEAKALFGDGAELTAVKNAFGGVNVGDPDSSYPAGPNLVFEVEPNDDHTTAMPLSWSAPPSGFDAIFKTEALGMIATPSDADDYQVTFKCGREIGVAMQVPVPFVLQLWHFDNNSNLVQDPTPVDTQAHAKSGDWCTAGTDVTYIAKVTSNGNSSPVFYALAIDAFGSPK